jgi:polyhydroxyalkanoate synthesis regulator phasin
MNEFNEAQRFVDEVTGTTQDKRHREQQAAERRLVQMVKKREKEIARRDMAAARKESAKP